ncbi:MAG: 4'-phosphopantetheinyl transferase superfamily protein [Chloroflexota bacterium]|nr:4'-phosphopantetheinyl transferase superfamily protein [Chloroflexota bacterium]MDE2941575.1 4'-phosphopantetheinyl transferase superfamily protein [Chloroflexota bacterium]MDE3268056.1 4'-phosphopantetheinyl transferase superfamily protein [Chloroflexota bacterium]
MGDAVVLHVDLTTDADREAQALAWLSDEERERCSRFLYDGPRRRFALCRAALRAVLCDRLGCSNRELAIGEQEFGKPYAALGGEMATISFNVSHSGDHGLIAYAPDGWLGVDIEERSARRSLRELIETTLTPVEREELGSGSDQQRLHSFLKLWTIKEAFIKAIGLGVSISMSELEVPAAMRHGTTGGVFDLPQTPGVSWRLEDLGTERFAAAVAHEVGSK